MKRHPALADLSRDHHHVLVHAKALIKTPDEQTATQNAQRYLEHWNEAVNWHFIEEEHTILPLLQRHTTLASNDHVQRLIEDHAWIRDRTETLTQRAGEEEPLNDALSLIGQRLHDHARFEDRELFPHLEATLTDDELEELHERSRRFRRQHRGDASIGPRTTRHDPET